MSATPRGSATSAATITTATNRHLTFLHESDYRRHRRGQHPQGYRPTRFQRRYSSDELRVVLHVLPGGKG